MATEGNNLSEYDEAVVPEIGIKKVGIVVAQWNLHITGNLLSGVLSTLKKHGATDDQIIIRKVPGSFELALGAQQLLERDNELTGVICIGSVIQGETKHFDFVCGATAMGIKDVSLKYNKPVVFGVLTDNTLQQAIDRSGGKHGNKGDEAAITLLQMI